MKVHTIGHSNIPIEHFLEKVCQCTIEVIIDVRSVPYSRFSPQFNLKRIKESLNFIGIEYIFMGNVLGGRIADAACYIDRQIPNRKKNIAELIDFTVLHNKKWFQSGIEEILKTAEKMRTAIMCSEEDPSRCHRSLLIGQALENRACMVEHIRLKEKEPEQKTLF